MAHNHSRYHTSTRILVIDDDPAIRASLRTLLEYEGYQIVGATTGWEGLALVERATPDLVLLDVDMPGLGGFDVLRQLHKAHESLPVVMISAHGCASVAIEARRCGAVDFLEKPFQSADGLLTTIHDAVTPARRGEKVAAHCGRGDQSRNPGRRE